jgi:tetratricopeptide (TPR) repeat protein
LFPEAHNNRGNVLNDLKRYDEALVNFDRAIALNPNYAQANVNMGLLLLLLGNYADGWPLYEWRWKITPYKYASRSFSQPLWLGETSIAGKTILLYSEQGFGDAIQFVRYVPMVTSLGADVILEIQADLVPLVGHLSSSSRIIAKGDQLPEFNFHCPLMSLPLALGTTSTEKIPSSVPYLTLASSIRNKWHDRLGKRVRPRVGLVWSGNPCHQNDRNRSIRLRIFEPLLSMDLDFHVLQKEIRDDDRVTVLEFNNIQLHENEISDFSDTAALISELDLVISVDTSVAHLAGALGKEVWILLPFSPDYRWMLHRTDTPWYPTARFFRQSEIGNWQSVIADVVTEISIRTGENVSDES